MAMGKTTCPTCGSLFQVDSSMVGQSVRCPWCGEEIYMEGVDEPQEAPDGVLHSPAPATAQEETPANPPPPTPSPLHRYVADDDEPRCRFGGTAKSTSPGMYALFALVALLCAFLGYRSAVKSHRPTPTASQGAAIQPLPSDSYTVADDTPAEAKPNDGDEEGVDLPADDTDTVADESQIAESTDTAAEAAEPDETDPFESVAADDDTEKQDDGEGVFADEPSGPFMLDAATLTDAYRDSGISIYKCRVALKDFEKAVATANAVAETNRANMAQIVAKYLKNGMSKAQAAGDLDHVVAFKKALDTADMGIEGDLEEIVKLRTARDAQKTKIDNALLSAGTTAAKGLYGTLEWQKKETTRKNEIEQAQKIAAFQKQIEEWMTKTKEIAAKGRASSRATRQLEVRRPAAPVRQSVRETRPADPTGGQMWRRIQVDARAFKGMPFSAKAGDVITVKYVDGTWTYSPSVQKQNPDADRDVEDGNRCALADSLHLGDTLALLPSNTKGEPFEYTVEKDGAFCLRINDGDHESPYRDNRGFVTYMVKVVSASGGRASPRTIAGEGIPTASSGFSNHVLTGTQTDVSVTLPRSPTPHVVKEQYLVPQGKELIIEAGATLVFDEGASLYCEGTLKMNGTEQAPIICKGRMTKVGYWNGITVRTSDSEINWIRVRDAKAALTCFDANPMIRNSAFFKNEKGIHLHICSSLFENCTINENLGTGVFCEHGRAGNDNGATFTKCSIIGNGKYGIDCGYYGSPQLKACLVTKNVKGGIFTYCYNCNVGAQNCIIMDNKGYDVEHNASPLLNFRQNYWGPSATRLLQQRGDGYNLPNIKDGRDSGGGNIVDIAEFLTEPPKDCGATVRW